MRRWLALALAAALVCLFCVGTVSAARYRPLDVGNHNDYGGGDYGGDYGGGNYGGDYDSWDDDDFGGGIFIFGGSGGGSGGTVFGVVAVIVIVALVFFLQKRRRAGAPRVSRRLPATPGNHDDQIVGALQQIDPNFSREQFLSWVKEVFITLQQAWTARDWARIRPFEKEELYQQHQAQLQEYIRLGRINHIERINVNQAYLHHYERDNQYEYLTVFLAVRMVDYIADEKTGQVLKGSRDRDCYMNYLLTFMRRTGVQTDAAKSNHSTVSCPHCGAPVQVTSAGQCEYCGFIITTGEHDWVLSNLDSVRPGMACDERGVVIHTPPAPPQDPPAGPPQPPAPTA